MQMYSRFTDLEIPICGDFVGAKGLGTVSLDQVCEEMFVAIQVREEMCQV